MKEERDEIESLPWKDMADAPQDGTIIAVRFHAWNVESNPAQIQLAQWLRGKWCAPWQIDSMVYADGWITLGELNDA